jgi:hypothetical protein
MKRKVDLSINDLHFQLFTNNMVYNRCDIKEKENKKIIEK